MMDNPRRAAGSRLYTFDKFKGYHDPPQLLRLLAPFFDAGLLDAGARAGVTAGGDFRPAFDQLHDNRRYSSLLVPAMSVLPDTPEQVAHMTDPFRADSSVDFDGVFIDGCKSWYATKYFMREMGRCTRPGAYFIFQDYLCYTCFWIPAFLGIMHDHFELAAHIDMTYVFRLTRPLDDGTVEARCPDSPHALGAPFFDALFVRLLADAAGRNDEEALICHYIQHAGALACVGNREEAKALLTVLANSGVPGRFLPLVRLALHSPTYVPDGAGGMQEIRL